MNVYEMEGFLRGKCLPGDLLVGESHAAYLVRKLNESATLKADRDAQQKRADALAVENAELKKSEVEFNEYCRFECENEGGEWVDDFTETPATDAAIAAIRDEGAVRALNHLRDCQLISPVVAELKADELREAK